MEPLFGPEAADCSRGIRSIAAPCVNSRKILVISQGPAAIDLGKTALNPSEYRLLAAVACGLDLRSWGEPVQAPAAMRPGSQAASSG